MFRVVCSGFWSGERVGLLNTPYTVVGIMISISCRYLTIMRTSLPRRAIG